VSTHPSGDSIVVAALQPGQANAKQDQRDVDLVDHNQIPQNAMISMREARHDCIALIIHTLLLNCRLPGNVYRLQRRKSIDALLLQVNK
jgi:hypothetical protein